MNGHSEALNGEPVADNGRSRISVLVVGAGIGGLTCALECWRKGFQVQILERSPEEKLIGIRLDVSKY